MSYAIACCFVVHVDDDHLRVHGALALSPMLEGLLKSVWFTNRWQSLTIHVLPNLSCGMFEAFLIYGA